jgi:hypothetical protein
MKCVEVELQKEQHMAKYGPNGFVAWQNRHSIYCKYLPYIAMTTPTTLKTKTKISVTPSDALLPLVATFLVAVVVVAPDPVVVVVGVVVSAVVSALVLVLVLLVVALVTPGLAAAIQSPRLSFANKISLPFK